MPRSNPPQEPDYEEDLVDEEYESLEGDEEIDEEIGDEGDYADEVTDEEPEGDEEPPEETEEEPSDGDEPDAILVPWTDENGDEKELEISLDEIPDLVRDAEYGRKMAEYTRDSENYFKKNESLITIGQGVMQDPFLLDVATWRGRGYSEQEIVNSLYLQYNGQMDNNPNPTSIDEEMPDVDDASRQYFQKAIEKQVNPLREQLSLEQNARIEQQNLARNNEVIASSLWEENIPELTQQEQSKFISTFKEVYPQYDTRKAVLTPAQIKAVLRASGISDARKQAATTATTTKKVTIKPNTSAVVRGKTAPAITPAKAGTQAIKKSISTANSRDAKLARLGNAGIF